MADRLQLLREKMQAQDLPALLVTKPEHRYYLAGFSGSAGALLITAEQKLLLTDFRYFLQVARESPDWELVKVEQSLTDTLRATLRDVGIRRIGFEPDHLTVAQYRQYGGGDPDMPYTLEAAPNFIEELRLVKDPQEVALIRQAAAITDAAYAHLLTHVALGVTELELALEAEWFMRQHGAETAFDIIVAAGPNSALPHAQPGEHRLQPGDLVVVDMGARKQHYCSDMTRTFAVAEATPIAQSIYAICLQAQLAGVNGIHAGMTGREGDAIVRDVIAGAGYGDQYGHGTGHGVGLEIHEAPRINRTGSEAVPNGSIITIEPGIYLPDIGGVRIEDMCLVTASGVEILTGTPKPTELAIYG